MTLSAVGSVRFKVYAVLLLVNTSILAVSAHINNFQRFFYRADVFPFAMSVATMVFVSAMMFMDIKFKNIVTARPIFELGWLVVLGTLWLVSNAFSTSRWRYASPAVCQTIPSDAQYAPYRTWCNELQALRVLVWIEWSILFCIFVYLLRWTITQRNNGRLDVLSTAFSQFSVHPSTRLHQRGATDSEFLQWEKFPPQSMSQSPRSGNKEFVRDTYNDTEHSQYEHHLEPPYTQFSEPQYTQSLEPQYTHYPEPQYTHYPETQYTHSSQGPHPIEVPYMDRSQEQNIPPLQAQARSAHFSHPYFSGLERVL